MFRGDLSRKRLSLMLPTNITFSASFMREPISYSEHKFLGGPMASTFLSSHVSHSLMKAWGVIHEILHIGMGILIRVLFRCSLEPARSWEIAR
ncbi:hypothetical protein FHT72_006791 [Rhizobium sp. BK077]|nr:hypothetical protein [Rhizobium sp. BK112]MBB3372256.1 hypothetical protein [Rhizobium sp. BK077]MBB4182739.1 hypothetical protein [Rhizobium sp. BK109]PDS54576.1 hypothetical protein CO663_34525 [Rhizobium anhuiense]